MEQLKDSLLLQILLIEAIVLLSTFGLLFVARSNYAREVKKIEKAQETNRDQTNWWNAANREKGELKTLAFLVLVVGQVVVGFII